MFLILNSLMFGCLDNNAGHLAFWLLFQWRHLNHLYAWTCLMMMTMTQVITLLMLKRLHVDPLTMKLGGLNFPEMRVGLFALQRPVPPTSPSLSLQSLPRIYLTSHSYPSLSKGSLFPSFIGELEFPGFPFTTSPSCSSLYSYYPVFIRL